MSDSGIFGHFDNMGGKKKRRRRRKPRRQIRAFQKLFDDLKLPTRKKSKTTTKPAGFDRRYNITYMQFK